MTEGTGCTNTFFVFTWHFMCFFKNLNVHGGGGIANSPRMYQTAELRSNIYCIPKLFSGVKITYYPKFFFEVV
jgi:hypothetical protein